METEEVIINDCKYLELDEKCNDFYKLEDPRLHFDCELSECNVNGKCLFPDHVRNPQCCIGYTGGGEKRVIVTKEQLKKYYEEDFGFEFEDRKRFHKGKPDILVEGLS